MERATVSLCWISYFAAEAFLAASARRLWPSDIFFFVSSDITRFFAGATAVVVEAFFVAFLDVPFAAVLLAVFFVALFAAFLAAFFAAGAVVGATAPCGSGLGPRVYSRSRRAYCR